VVSVPILRLSPFSWALVFRLLWLSGLAKEPESYTQAKERAHQAADQLAALAGRTPESVLLLGHGFMNRLIARQLQGGGWAETGNSGSGYWSVAVYEKAG
jgi:broad specificity phosphatase PhoE